MERMISTLNILRFAKLYQIEADGQKRSMLKSLLIEEENRLGACYERMDLCERVIAEGASRIEKQKELIEKFKSRGLDTREPERLLKQLQECNQLFNDVRRNFRAA